ncbi:MAG: sugar phosphate isomerase/epimerase [Deltaproteobacteria bacterium]|nr:sugar phosphate isomerase/epimerase [Deltaproteobacteria bacterium]
MHSQSINHPPPRVIAPSRAVVLSAGTLYTMKFTEIFEIASECGYDGIELIINTTFENGSPHKIIEKLLPICPILSIHAPFFKLRGWGHSGTSLIRCIELARDFEIPLVNFHPPFWLPPEFTFLRWFHKIKDFQNLVNDSKVIVTLENMPYIGNLIHYNPNILRKSEDMLKFIEKHNLFMTFDTTHKGSHNPNFLGEFQRLLVSGRIKNIHFSDYGHGREHLFPGRGILPLTRFLYMLKKHSYEGAVTLELSPIELPSKRDLIVESLSEVNEYLRSELF